MPEWYSIKYLLLLKERRKMNFRKLHIDNKSDLEFVERLYIESFPPTERRSVAKMHSLIENNDLFEVFVCVEDDNRIGFISTWTFDSFTYLEHFAISPEFRNGGYGQKVLDLLFDITTLPLVGEIELPDSSEMAQRRSGFYERLGFTIWDFEYLQPPYEDGYEPIPMRLITYRDINMQEKFQQIKRQLYKDVYQVENVQMIVK